MSGQSLVQRRHSHLSHRDSTNPPSTKLQSMASLSGRLLLSSRRERRIIAPDAAQRNPGKAHPRILPPRRGDANRLRHRDPTHHKHTLYIAALVIFTPPVRQTTTKTLILCTPQTSFCSLCI